MAPSAAAELDLRYVHPDDGARAFAAIAAIVAEANVPGTRAALETTGEFEPLVATEASERLYEHYAACARALGHAVVPMFAGGCSDAGFAAEAGAPTICAVGPMGGRAHTPEEYLEVASIVPRAQALALAIMPSAMLLPAWALAFGPRCGRTRARPWHWGNACPDTSNRRR